MKLMARYLTAVLMVAYSGGALALDRAIELQIMSYRAIDEYSVAEILRSARAKRLFGFEVQGMNAIAPTPDGNVRVAVCYWVGDMPHVDDRAVCNIRFLLGDNGKLLPDPDSRNLSNAILIENKAFEVALQIEHDAVCGTSTNREERKC